MINKMIQDGTLESYSYKDGKEEIKSKAAPQWHISFQVIDKKALKEKKASKVVDIDMTVPQDQIDYALSQIDRALRQLEGRGSKLSEPEETA